MNTLNRFRDPLKNQNNVLIHKTKHNKVFLGLSYLTMKIRYDFLMKVVNSATEDEEAPAESLRTLKTFSVLLEFWDSAAFFFSKLSFLV